MSFEKQEVVTLSTRKKERDSADQHPKAERRNASRKSNTSRERKQINLSHTGVKADLVAVEWHDALSTGAWEKPDAVRGELGFCISVGFLVNMTKEIITLSGNISLTSGHVGLLMNIPAKSVKKITSIKTMIYEEAKN